MNASKCIREQEKQDKDNKHIIGDWSEINPGIDSISYIDSLNKMNYIL